MSSSAFSNLLKATVFLQTAAGADAALTPTLPGLSKATLPALLRDFGVYVGQELGLLESLSLFMLDVKSLAVFENVPLDRRSPHTRGVGTRCCWWPPS